MTRRTYVAFPRARVRSTLWCMRVRSRSALVVALLVASAGWSQAAIASDGDGDVRIVRSCGRGVVSELRLEQDDELKVRFEVDRGRPRSTWRVVIVHERRVVWRAGARRAGSTGSFELERTLRDLPGSDTVSVRASDTRGVVCRVSATLR